MPVYIIADNIISPLGITTQENFGHLLNGDSGITRHSPGPVHEQPFFASLMAEDKMGVHAESYTRFEKIIIHSISSAVNSCAIDITDASTGIVIATTKGNIGLIETRNYAAQKLPLHYSAGLIAAHFGNPNTPVVVSNACISGLTALTAGKRLIEAGRFKNVVVTGADIITQFVFSGFNAFQAISSEACKPYDANRSGVTLGEAAATIILSGSASSGIRISGTGGTNDANHISGPSRTGKELSIAISRAINNAGLINKNIDFISAHGTATVYNDEMEAKAFNNAELGEVPVNSLKGYYGHTLGAAGVLESVIAVQSLKTGIVLPTLGFVTLGVSQPINVVHTLIKKQVNHCLKTASGFGGCNAAVIFSN
jgi:3-oxoacyl-[acyl-carrier-protein] synthase-1